MSTTTFIELTNRVLRKINEVELDTTTFANTRGIHSTAKDAVADAVERINQEPYKWPFNAVEHTQKLSAGVEEYAWMSNFKQVDWNSFQIQKDDNSSYTRKLIRWNRDQWYTLNRDRDYDSLLSGLDMPVFVSPAHGVGFAISPSPNKEYTLKYRYFKHPERLQLHGDMPTIPSYYDNVIQSAALQIMYDFLEDIERSQFQEAQYEKGIKHMKSILGNGDIHLTDNRV